MKPINLALTFILGIISINAWSALEPVTLQLKWDHEFQFAGYYTALEKGYYKEAGLDVTIKSRVKPDGSLLDVFQELENGNADFIVAGPDLIISIANGLPAKIIATISQLSPYSFVTLKGKFKSPADFAGHRIDITEPHWGPVELHAIISKNGGDPSNVKILNAPPSLELLIEDKADVVATYIESATWQMKEMGKEFDIFRASDYGIYFYGDTLLASDKIIESKPEVVAKFKEATLKGWQYAHENPEEIAKLIATNYKRVFDWYEDFEGYNLHQSKIMKSLALYPTVTLGHTSIERWQKTVSYFKEAGYIDTEIQAEDMIYRPEAAAQEKSRFIITLMVSLVAVLLIAAVGILFLNRSLKKKIAEKTQDLRKLNQDLEAKVAERTKDLEEAKDQAIKYARAKTEFITNISHELRTPLNAVIGLSELSLRTHDSEKQWNYLKKINTSANSLLNIINDILDLSKIESGKLVLDKTPFHFQTFITEIDDIFRYTAESKGLDFYIAASSDIPEVIVSSPTRIKQILLNLLGNAIKFTSQGSIKLEFTLDSENRNLLKIKVQDTGIGIENDKMDQLFQPFEQADNTISREYGGTGLGLSISEKLVTLLGGTIKATSKLNEGSTFIVELPFKTPTKKQIDDINLEIQTIDQVPVFANLKALIIEDQPLNREVIVGILHECGINSVEAENGTIGIQLAEQDHFDIIFLDIQMPGIDGFETLQALRQKLQLKDDIIVAMTAHAQQGYDKLCIAKGFSDYLAKPIESRNVYKILLKSFKPINYKTAYDKPSKKEATIPVSNDDQSIFDEALIDIKAGKKRLRGKEDRYQSLLSNFVSREPNLVQVLTEHVGRGDMEKAKDFAHEMKGVTGNLALDSLHYCLEDLESAIAADNSKEIHQKLVDLGRAWRITEREINKYLQYSKH